MNKNKLQEITNEENPKLVSMIDYILESREIFKDNNQESLKEELIKSIDEEIATNGYTGNFVFMLFSKFLDNPSLKLKVDIDICKVLEPYLPFVDKSYANLNNSIDYEIEDIEYYYDLLFDSNNLKLTFFSMNQSSVINAIKVFYKKDLDRFKDSLMYILSNPNMDKDALIDLILEMNNLPKKGKSKNIKDKIFDFLKSKYSKNTGLIDFISYNKDNNGNATNYLTFESMSINNFQKYVFEMLDVLSKYGNYFNLDFSKFIGTVSYFDTNYEEIQREIYKYFMENPELVATNNQARENLCKFIYFILISHKKSYLLIKKIAIFYEDSALEDHLLSILTLEKEDCYKNINKLVSLILFYMYNLYYNDKSSYPNISGDEEEFCLVTTILFRTQLDNIILNGIIDIFGMDNFIKSIVSYLKHIERHNSLIVPKNSEAKINQVSNYVEKINNIYSNLLLQKSYYFVKDIIYYSFDLLYDYEILDIIYDKNELIKYIEEKNDIVIKFIMSLDFLEMKKFSFKSRILKIITEYFKENETDYGINLITEKLICSIIESFFSGYNKLSYSIESDNTCLKDYEKYTFGGDFYDGTTGITSLEYILKNMLIDSNNKIKDLNIGKIVGNLAYNKRIDGTKFLVLIDGISHLFKIYSNIFNKNINIVIDSILKWIDFYEYLRNSKRINNDDYNFLNLIQNSFCIDIAFLVNEMIDYNISTFYIHCSDFSEEDYDDNYLFIYSEFSKLEKYVNEYLENEYSNIIAISDENGNYYDFDKVIKARNTYVYSSKLLKVILRFMPKEKATKYLKNILMDRIHLLSNVGIKYIPEQKRNSPTSLKFNLLEEEYFTETFKHLSYNDAVDVILMIKNKIKEKDELNEYRYELYSAEAQLKDKISELICLNLLINSDNLPDILDSLKDEKEIEDLIQYVSRYLIYFEKYGKPKTEIEKVVKLFKLKNIFLGIIDFAKEKYPESKELLELDEQDVIGSIFKKSIGFNKLETELDKIDCESDLSFIQRSLFCDSEDKFDTSFKSLARQTKACLKIMANDKSFRKNLFDTVCYYKENVFKLKTDLKTFYNPYVFLVCIDKIKSVNITDSAYLVYTHCCLSNIQYMAKANMLYNDDNEKRNLCGFFNKTEKEVKEIFPDDEEEIGELKTECLPSLFINGPYGEYPDGEIWDIIDPLEFYDVTANFTFYKPFIRLNNKNYLK